MILTQEEGKKLVERRVGSPNAVFAVVIKAFDKIPFISARSTEMEYYIYYAFIREKEPLWLPNKSKGDRVTQSLPFGAMEINEAAGCITDNKDRCDRFFSVPDDLFDKDDIVAEMVICDRLYVDTEDPHRRKSTKYKGIEALDNYRSNVKDSHKDPEHLWRPVAELERITDHWLDEKITEADFKEYVINREFLNEPDFMNAAWKFERNIRFFSENVENNIVGLICPKKADDGTFNYIKETFTQPDGKECHLIYYTRDFDHIVRRIVMLLNGEKQHDAESQIKMYIPAYRIETDIFNRMEACKLPVDSLPVTDDDFIEDPRIIAYEDYSKTERIELPPVILQRFRETGSLLTYADGVLEACMRNAASRALNSRSIEVISIDPVIDEEEWNVSKLNVTFKNAKRNK